MKRTLTKYTDEQIVNNLIEHYYAGTPDEYESGKNWYAEAQQYAQVLSEEHGIPSYTAAAVISALSPNNKWERNKQDAKAVISVFQSGLNEDHVKVCTYNANKKKAFEILRGNTEISAKSPKTHAFAMNVGLQSPDHITIDKWHLRACLTHPLEGIVDTTESLTAVQYRRVEALTAQVARKFNLKGYEFQAIVWVGIKRRWNR